MKENDTTIMTSFFFSETFNFWAISTNLVKVFKCFTRLDRSMGSSLLGGTLNFSLWIAEVLALELVTFTVAELASPFAISSLYLARFWMLPPPPTLISFLNCIGENFSSPYLRPSPYLFFFLLTLSLVDPTLAAFIICGPLQFLVWKSFCISRKIWMRLNNFLPQWYILSVRNVTQC